MPQFPSRLSLPENVPSERAERHKKLVRSAWLGIAIRLLIITFELVGFAIFASAALFMDALASLLDVASTVFLIFCVKLADRPPDDEHPFGHGRYEPIAGMQLGLLLVLVGGGMVLQQGVDLFQGHADREVIDPRTWLIPFLAVVLLEICYRVAMRTAEEKNSPALASDAFHYRIDGLNSLFAMIVLLLGVFFPAWSIILDRMGAIIIALLMIGIGLYSARNNLNQLMDHVPKVEFFEKVRYAAKRVSGVLDTEKIRIQVYGPDAHVDIDIEVDPQLSVEKAHEISQKVRVEIQKDWSAVRDVTVHIEPFYMNDH